MQLNQRQIRNIAATAVLLLLVGLVAWYFGLFEGQGSDEAQIRRVTDRAVAEFNDHDWEDALRYCWVEPNTSERRRQWVNSVPRQANAIVIDSVLPQGPLIVPAGAEEYVVEVSIVAHGQVSFISGGRLNVPRGKIFYLKKNGVWLIDLERTAPQFGVMPPR